MKIVGIDPSFSSTGISLIDDNKVIKYDSFHQKGNCYIGNNFVNNACRLICDSIKEFIGTQSVIVVVEIPAPSKSGFYLSILHGWIISTLFSISNVEHIITVPCLACDSLIKNKLHSKSYIVDFCKSHKWIPAKRINNDIATSVVLSHVYKNYLTGKYKNKVFIVK